MTSAEIRRAFLDYFAKKQHTIVPSASLVPINDPTLLFTNAGMNQFKDVFLGLGERPYARVADTQKCMRVSGKHNDLEDVGYDTTHHTFFEMLGNWSFGDYYKKEAIGWAWQLLTQVFGIPGERLWATVFKDEYGELETDEEAAGHWRSETGIRPEQILYFGRKDNFWEMAETGPCGPCSEIHYDRGPETCDRQDDPHHVCQVNGDCSRFTELWNLVFIQYNKQAGGHLNPLPAKHVDTGMGFERVVALLQGVDSNYKTDLFMPVIRRVQEMLGHTNAQVEENIVAYRVIADHGRAITFMIGDGVMPGNEGRASVLRLILRRAARYGRLAGFDGPFLAQVAQVVIDTMGDYFIELKARRQFILNVITQEEERFLKTFNHGLQLMAERVEKLKAAGKTQIPGEEVFKLHATYGFPKDLTRIIAHEEYGFTIDEAGYQQAFKQHTEISGGSKLGEIAVDLLQIYADLLDRLKREGQLSEQGVNHNPYAGTELDGSVVAILRDGQIVDSAAEGQKIEIVLAATPFYLEAGGQVSDTGQIIEAAGAAAPQWSIAVNDVFQPVNGLIVHGGVLTSGAVKVGSPARAMVDSKRRWDIMRNHTATHVLHKELRRVLGTHVVQAGSLVAPDRLRFDFSHAHMVTAEELEEIEQAANAAILAGLPVAAGYKSYDELKQAIAAGEIMALFGEKYGDTVRVVQIGDDPIYSRELCGGTHVQNTQQIGALHIISEGSAAAGVRRIEAVTGRAAQQLVWRQLAALKQSAALLGVPPEEIYPRLHTLAAQLQDKEKQVKALQRKLARAEFERMLSQARKIKGVNLISLQVDAPDVAMLREMSDWFRDRLGSGVVVLATVLDDKPLIIATVTEDLTKRGLHAGKLVKEVAQVVGGGGGGKPTMAQAGGKEASRLAEALAKVDALVSEAIGKM
ncbi:MAG: alanine--tRNA ligase [Anaerolineae bacterium]|nr:alanine--tRNA ligase [Anaerolineae bacterium]